MRRKAGLLAAIGLLCAAATAAAQSEPPADVAAETDNTIVVTGRSEPQTRSETYEQAREVSRVSPFQLYEEPLPRFVAPLCPGVFGLKADLAGEMVDRIRANVRRIEVPLAEGDCSPNLLIAFVEDGRLFLTEHERRQPELFRLVAQAEREELLAGASPARVWNNIVVMNLQTGRPLYYRNGQPELLAVRGQMRRDRMPMRSDIISALVLFDREAVVGMTLEQLADYATMRGLSHTRPASSDAPLETILSLFDGENVAGLTSFDVGYLRSIYSTENLSAASSLLRVSRLARQEAVAEDRP